MRLEMEKNDTEVRSWSRKELEELRVFIHTVLGEIDSMNSGVKRRKNEMIVELDVLQGKAKKLEEG